MNINYKSPQLTQTLRAVWKRKFVTQVKKQTLVSKSCLGTLDKARKRKLSTAYGVIALTAIGSGGALLLSMQAPQWPTFMKYVNKNEQSSFPNSSNSSEDDENFCVGLDDEWLAHLNVPDNNAIGSRIHVFVSDIINFNVNKIWDWLFPWEQSKSDDPWVLLELTKSHNFWIRQMGVASLANKTDWADYKYRVIAQACDHRTTIALARYPHAKDDFFLPQPKLQDSKNEILQDLKFQIARLPLPPPFTCSHYYRDVALDPEIRFQGDPLGMDVLTQFYSLPGEAERKKEKSIGFCLEAIVSYTTMSDYAYSFVNNNGLAVLQRLLEENCEHWVQMYVVTILANISLVPQLIDIIVSTGWITVLRKWSRSNNAALSLMALTTMANLDRDWTYKDLYQDMVLLHPTQRNSRPVSADVILVHGLRGGAVKTWRQRDWVGENNKISTSTSSCWPRDWLASDIPNIRIVSIGYHSILHRWGDHCPYEQDKRTIEGRVRELLTKLKQAGVGSRPVIWLGHSMGGLLIKQLISLGEQESEFSQFSRQTRGVIFYSVPHHGSSVVDVMMYAKYLLFPSVEVQEMHTGSSKLSDLQTDFIQFMKGNSLPCLSFGENEKTTFGRTLPKVLLVPLHSSDPGIGKFVSVPNNHINTCKPCNQDDIIYQMTLSFVQDILSDIR